MSRQLQLADFQQIAQRHRLTVILEESLKEPFLAIVNLKARTLSVVCRDTFSQKHSIKWAEDVINAEAPATLEERTALEQSNNCWKALLQTDYGFGVTNLQEIKQNSYVSLYEGYFINKNQKPLASDLKKKEYFQALSDRIYTVSFTPTDATKHSGLISAHFYRGFGGFMQHLPNEDEMESYQIVPDFKDRVVAENLLRVNFKSRVFLRAKKNIPPLSHLGFSYSEYWCGREMSPVLFDQWTGFSLHPSSYQIIKYFVNFRDTQLGQDEYYNFSIRELQNLGKGDYCSLGDLIYKPEHLNGIRDLKTGKIVPQFMYSQVWVPHLTGDDYLKVASSYFSGHDPEDMVSPKHIKRVITYYQRAQLLFSQEKDTQKSAYCQKQIQFYQKHLQKLGVSGDENAETKALMAKYAVKNEKTPPDKNLAFRRAAAMGNLDDLKALLLLGVQINAQGAGSKKTALHHAVIANHFDVFVFLISIKADQSLRDEHKKTAMNYLKVGSPIDLAAKEFFKNKKAKAVPSSAIIQPGLK